MEESSAMSAPLRTLEQRFAEIQRRMWRLESSPGPMNVRLPIISINLPPPAPKPGFQTCLQIVGKRIQGRIWASARCTGCYTIDAEAGGGTTLKDFKVSAVTGLNGLHFFDFVAGPNDWQKNGFGAITLEQYASTDGTCVGLEDTLTGTIDAIVSCADPGNVFFTAGGSVVGAGVGGVGSINVSLFVNASGISIKKKIPNELTCGSSGDASMVGASGGFLEIIR